MLKDLELKEEGYNAIHGEVVTPMKTRPQLQLYIKPHLEN